MNVTKTAAPAATGALGQVSARLAEWPAVLGPPGPSHRADPCPGPRAGVV